MGRMGTSTVSIYMYDDRKSAAPLCFLPLHARPRSSSDIPLHSAVSPHSAVPLHSAVATSCPHLQAPEVRERVHELGLHGEACLKTYVITYHAYL